MSWACHAEMKAGGGPSHERTGQGSGMVDAAAAVTSGTGRKLAADP